MRGWFLCSDWPETKSCGTRRHVVILVVELGVEPYDHCASIGFAGRCDWEGLVEANTCGIVIV
jgi:hypothetical protein